MQLIGPFRKELRCRTGERCSRRSLKYDDGRKATDAAAARGQSLPLPRSGLVQQNLSVTRKSTGEGLPETEDLCSKDTMSLAHGARLSSRFRRITTPPVKIPQLRP